MERSVPAAPRRVVHGNKNETMTRFLLIVVLLLPISAAVADVDKGLAAYDEGDYATALREWRPLAEQGVAAAQNNLGAMYDKGEGVPQDYSTAVRWYSLAAEQGYAYAQSNLGIMYALGQGVIQDNVYAHMWLNIAASQGNENAVKSRDLIAKVMTPAQIAEAQKLARECVKKNYKDC